MWIQIFRSVDIGSVEADRKQGGRKESHPTYARSVPIVVPVRGYREPTSLQDGKREKHGSNEPLQPDGPEETNAYVIRSLVVQVGGSTDSTCTGRRQSMAH